MKKLSLLKILEWDGPGRPQGPGPQNAHHFNKHPRTKKTQHFPYSSNSFPYVDPDIDLEHGDESIDSLDSISEFFKFTVRADDNLRIPSHDAEGSGPPAAYGKGLNTFDNFDPDSENMDDEKQELRLDNFDDRMDVKVRDISEMVGGRSRHPRDPSDYSTKQPWANGLPTSDQKEIELADELLDELDESADSDFSKWMSSKKGKGPKSDLKFWDIINGEGSYLMNTEDEIKERNKKNDKE